MNVINKLGGVGCHCWLVQQCPASVATAGLPNDLRLSATAGLSSSARRAAFTLVELLVTMVIITIIAAAVLFAMYGAQEAARAAKTRSTINKLNAIIMTHWESYRTRRAPVVLTAGDNPQSSALKRLLGIRALMRMEMPERWTDILDDGGSIIARPAVSQAYLYQVQNNRWADGSQKTPSPRYQGAECLYLIVAAGGDEESYLAEFQNSEIGDVDGDGMKEFIDGWRRPIGFLRWAPGFTQSSDIQSSDVTKPENQDPFNPWGIPSRDASGQQTFQPYALFPLIYSPGPDGAFGLTSDYLEPGDLDSPITAVLQRAFQYKGAQNDPFASQFKPLLMGSPDGEPDAFLDNIHNHRIEVN